MACLAIQSFRRAYPFIGISALETNQSFLVYLYEFQTEFMLVSSLFLIRQTITDVLNT